MAVRVYGKMEVILVTGVQWAAAAVEDINYCTITEFWLEVSDRGSLPESDWGPCASDLRVSEFEIFLPPPPPLPIGAPSPARLSLCSLLSDIAWNSVLEHAGDSKQKSIREPDATLPSFDSTNVGDTLDPLTFIDPLLPPPPAIFLVSTVDISQSFAVWEPQACSSLTRDSLLSSSVGSDLDRRFDHIGIYIAVFFFCFDGAHLDQSPNYSMERTA
ncbi:hypothetical protein B0H13DRAFT_1889432 [Mycena leptocephala]|nr:hypothetical protein B0H13DRAFT_1889432 [Mycena leptocephala]